MSDSQIRTADLCDQYSDDTESHLQTVASIFRHYGKKPAFAGIISTVQIFENHSLIFEMLKEKGHGKVLIVDGGGSLNCSLFGDQMAATAEKNGWQGVIIHGCVRDSHQLDQINLGIRALNTCPKRAPKTGNIGEKNVTVNFGGATFSPGYWVCADKDGIIIATKPLL